MGTSTIPVAIVDDHPVARHGLATMLAPFPDVDVVAAVAAPADLPRADGRLTADLVVLDLYLTPDTIADVPSLDAVAALAAEVPVLVMSASRRSGDVLAAVQAGASGYVTKHAGEDAFLAAIGAVAAGQFHLSAQLADILQAELDPHGPAAATVVLSDREQETLGYIAQGFTHGQTATRMGIGKATVDTYVGRIRAKLHVGNKAELALAALDQLRRRSDRAG
jgi:two-component system nitrate/nitrite response regulator NarL